MFSTTTGELFFGVLFDLVGGLLVVGAEGFDEGLALPLEGQRVVAAGAFPKECHVRDPIPAAHANLPLGVAQASVGGTGGYANCRISPCCSVGYGQR